MLMRLNLGIIMNSLPNGIVNPRIQAAIDANAQLLLMGDLATETSPGVNVPFVNPWVNVLNNIETFTFNGIDNYLDTGIVPDSTTVLKVYGNFITTSGTQYFAGCRASSNSKTYGFGVISGLLKLYFGDGFPVGVNTTDTNHHLYEVNNFELLQDSSVKATSTSSFTAITNSIYAGAINENGIALDFANFRCTAIVIEHSGITYTLQPNKDENNFVDQYGTKYTINGTVNSNQFDRSGDVDLFGFAETTASGWDEVAINQTNYAGINYDFHKGTDGWTSSRSSMSVSDNTMTLTGDGISAYMFLLKNDSLEYVEGNKIAICSKMKSGNNLVNYFESRITASGMSLVIGRLQDSPIQSQTYEVCSINTLTAGGSGNCSISIGAYFGSDNHLNEQIEIEEVMIFDLTKLNSKYPELNLLTKTESEINAMKYELLGLQSIMPMLKADGTDDYGIIANNPNLDPTGTEDFAISGVFKTPSVLDVGYIISKNESESSDVQWGIVMYDTGRFSPSINGTQYHQDGVLLPDTMHSYLVKRIGNRLKIVVDGNEVYNLGNSQSLTSTPFVTMFGRSGISDGSVIASMLKASIGYLAFYYNGATGLNEADIDNAHNLLRTPYF